MYTNDTLHTAACLWEAALEALAAGEAEEAANPQPVAEHSFERSLYSYRNNHGTCTLRQVVVELAPRCDAAWDAMSDDERDSAECFDWVFVPNWLRDNFFAIVRGGK